jgi:manganese transport protein
MNENHSTASLSEVHSSVDTTRPTSWWRKLFAFMGPAYLISVGYMDPGNWATDLAGGSQYGYALIWVLLMSNLMALLLQSLSARLGIVRGRDLAQASRETYPKFVNLSLYALAEIAISACDLAEVLGMAIGLQLLFDLPLLWGVTITVLDSFILLFLMNYGIRKMEAFILGLVSIIGISFLAQMIIAKPAIGEVVKGFVPSLPGETALYLAIGIIGATVMPHNLYLHSSLVQTRKIDQTKEGMRKAIRFNVIDSAIALNLAFFVNAAILILAASTFFKNGFFEVAEIQDAHQLLEPLLGSAWAPTLFAIALIASGQSSTITGTLAGQIIMEGYINLRIQPWIRRLITRLIAIIPALLVIGLLGEQMTGKMLVLSQVILSLQLGFAVIPLIHFVSDKGKMKGFEIKPLAKFLAWFSAAIIVSLNVKLVFETIVKWIGEAENPTALWFTVVPIAIGIFILLLYVTFAPFFQRFKKERKLLHQSGKTLETMALQPYKKIAVAIDFSSMDTLNISSALKQGGKQASYVLIHIVESAGAHLYGSDIKDFETIEDIKSLEEYAAQLVKEGYRCEIKIGFGNPKRAIPKLVNETNADLLVLGAHGHHFLKDLIFGTTVDAVRHRVKVPLLIVK